MKPASKPSICRICSENCGILVTDQDNSIRITGNPAHPISRGFICFKGSHFGSVHLSSDRLSHPLVKTKSGWKEISYESALDILASNMIRNKTDCGAESIVFYKGEALKHQEVSQYLRHLAYAFDSPNYITVGSLCHAALDLGYAITAQNLLPPDFQTLKTAVVWGANPSASHPCLFHQLSKAVEQGITRYRRGLTGLIGIIR
ncbi:MAG: molybdopterin-dependent oxidoreductase [Desulfatirhabdiaceae bacterium]